MNKNFAHTKKEWRGYQTKVGQIFFKFCKNDFLLSLFSEKTPLTIGFGSVKSRDRHVLRQGLKKSVKFEDFIFSKFSARK
jgi:hypothetical protein